MSALDTSTIVVQNSQLTTMPLASSPQFSLGNILCVIWVITGVVVVDCEFEVVVFCAVKVLGLVVVVVDVEAMELVEVIVEMLGLVEIEVVDFLGLVEFVAVDVWCMAIVESLFNRDPKLHQFKINDMTT
jgi:hypothetical protein